MFLGLLFFLASGVSLTIVNAKATTTTVRNIIPKRIVLQHNFRQFIYRYPSFYIQHSKLYRYVFVQQLFETCCRKGTQTLWENFYFKGNRVTIFSAIPIMLQLIPQVVGLNTEPRKATIVRPYFSKIICVRQHANSN